MVYLAIECEADGGHLGKVWGLEVCKTRNTAEEFLKKWMDPSKGRPDMPWKPYTMDGKSGFYTPAGWGGMFCYIEEKEIK